MRAALWCRLLGVSVSILIACDQSDGAADAGSGDASNTFDSGVPNESSDASIDGASPKEGGAEVLGHVAPASAMALNCDHCAKNAVWPTVPFGTLRLWDSDATWATLETHRGVYDWTYLDVALDYVASNHLQALYTFGHVPCWATAGTCSPASWSAAPPTTNQDFFDFVTALVAHCSAAGSCVKDNIKTFEMWNEANDPTFWSGSIAQLMPLVSGAAPIIKSAVTGAQLTTPSATSTGGTRASWMTSWLQAGGTAYADIMAYHVYLDGLTPEAQLSVITTMQGVAAANGMGAKPEWDTEGGWSGSATTMCPATLSSEDCSGQLARWYVLQFAAGIGEFTWYAWDDISPAGPTYGVVDQWLVGASFKAPCGANVAGVWTCEIERATPTGYHALIVWDPSGEDETFTAPSGFTSYQDLTGASHAIAGAVPIGVEPVLLVR